MHLIDFHILILLIDSSLRRSDSGRSVFVAIKPMRFVRMICEMMLLDAEFYSPNPQIFIDLTGFDGTDKHMRGQFSKQ